MGLVETSSRCCHSGDFVPSQVCPEARDFRRPGLLFRFRDFRTDCLLVEVASLLAAVDGRISAMPLGASVAPERWSAKIDAFLTGLGVL